MLLREYRFKFYLNARHSVTFDNLNNMVHPHTWEIVLFVEKADKEFFQFSKIESDIKIFLSKYEGKLLNEIAPFNVLMPTMENIGEVVSETVNELLRSNGWLLGKLEISENPSRTYIVSNQNTKEEMAKYCVDFDTQIVGPEPEMTLKTDDFEALESSNEESAMALEEQQVELRTGLNISSDSFCRISTVLGISAKRLSEVIFKRFLNNLNDEHASSSIKYILISLLVISLSAGMMIIYVTHSGFYPWGSDSWYHLFKGNLLYNSILSGDFFPLYSEIWYNGIQPLRYWAPFPHYILAVIELITKGNVPLSFNIFVVIVYVIGAFGWILWGIKTNRKVIAISLAVMWFFLPDNLRVLFSEGNLSRVAVTAIFPYLLFFVWSYLEDGRRKHAVFVSLLMVLITFCHAMIAAMVGITLFLFVLIYGIAEKKMKRAVQILTASFLGIVISGIWLFPALKGNILSLVQSELIDMMTFPALQSINPFIRLSQPDEFYFGITILIITVAGIILADRKGKVAFLITGLIFFGTTKGFVPILSKIPLGQLFWMMRFTPLAMGMFFLGLLMWKKAKKQAAFIFIVLIFIDSMVSFVVLGHDRNMPIEIQKAIKPAIDITTQRVALLDESEFGSYPSYYFSYNESGKPINQVFGSGWQGASTAQDLVWMNTALDKGLYAYVFDRCIELGADTIVVKNDLIKSRSNFLNIAKRFGYIKYFDTNLSMILKLPIDYPFASKVKYEGLAIGSYASNLAFIFPQLEEGYDQYIDDYTEAQLLNYKIVYLSGFKYRDKTKAEYMVKSLSQKGVRFLIDMTGLESDFYTSRASFMDVSAEPVEFFLNYPELDAYGQKLEFSKLPKDNNEWSTFYLENLDKNTGIADFEQQDMPFLGSKINDNIQFIGLNIPYFALETKDEKAIRLIEAVTGLKALEPPEREIVKVNISKTDNTINIKAGQEHVLTNIAGIDSFEILSGKYEQVHNLVLMEGKELTLKVKYPFLIEGIITSIMGVIGLVVLVIYIGGEGNV